MFLTELCLYMEVIKICIFRRFQVVLTIRPRFNLNLTSATSKKQWFRKHFLYFCYTVEMQNLLSKEYFFNAKIFVKRNYHRPWVLSILHGRRFQSQCSNKQHLRHSCMARRWTHCHTPGLCSWAQTTSVNKKKVELWNFTK